MAMFQQPGEKPYGEALGAAPGGVIAYSNGSDRFFGGEKSLVKAPVAGGEPNATVSVLMGYKHQCVEYARRWLFVRKGLLLPDVAWASMIFEQTAATDVTTGEEVPMKATRNHTAAAPESNALLIYPTTAHYPPGHVAVIVEVGDGFIRTAEQNQAAKPWGGNAFAQQLKVEKRADGTHHVTDADGFAPLGWVSFPTRPELHPAGATLPAVLPRFAHSTLETYELKRVTFTPKPKCHEWLDAAVPHEQQFIKTFGLDANRSRLAESEANYYTMNTDLFMACSRTGVQLHKLCLDATAKVLADDDLLSRFGIPVALWPRLKRSWERQPYAISGRFDFVVDAAGKQLKAFEYNADSASTLLECGVVQEKWAVNNGVAEGSRSSGARLTELLSKAWADAVAGGVVETGSLVHMCVDDDDEEKYTGLYVASRAEAAGLRTKLCVLFDAFEWRAGKVVDKATGAPVAAIWKTWAWESAITDWEAAATERPAGWAPKDGEAVRLCDLLLGDESIAVFEPMWKLIPSNKAVLPVLCELAPGHPALLQTEWKVTDALRKSGYAKKPIVGRCGKNVTIVAPGSGEVQLESDGQFASREMVYQELFSLPKRDDYFAIMGGWMIGAYYGGTGLREDKTVITNIESPYSAIRVLMKPPKGVTHASLDERDQKE